MMQNASIYFERLIVLKDVSYLRMFTPVPVCVKRVCSLGLNPSLVCRKRPQAVMHCWSETLDRGSVLRAWKGSTNWKEPFRWKQLSISLVFGT